MAGISAAYYLAVEHGHQNVVIVEQGNPLSLTSDKSTEAYRNWWPGPDWAMTAFMNRSLDLLEGIARATDNRINLNRRGYLFATADAGKIPFLQSMATMAEARGGGPARLHETASSAYTPSPDRGFDFGLTGADIVTDASLIRRHFPYLAPETVAVAHARRAGWLSAQQLGMVMLEAIRERGVKLLRGQVVGVDTAGGRVRTVHVEQQGERQSLEATHLVLAAGPMLKEMAQHDRRRSADPGRAPPQGQLPRPARLRAARRPMLIWLDEQYLPWSDDERAALAEDEETQWLLGKFPCGRARAPRGNRRPLVVHRPLQPQTMARPTSSFRCRSRRTTPRSRCAACRPWCRRSRPIIGKAARPYVDGGYYIKTRENRPLIGPLPVEGAYVSGAFSGFGVMASCAAGELVGPAHHGGRAARLCAGLSAVPLSGCTVPVLTGQLGRWRTALIG